MPTYDYRCQDCGNTVEMIHRISETPDTSCKKCKGGVMVKVILTAPATVVAPQHQAAGSKLRYYGVKNPITGEGITRHTDVSSPPGINVKKVK